MDFPIGDPTTSIPDLAIRLGLDDSDTLLLTGKSQGHVAPERICKALGVPSGSTYSVARRAARGLPERSE